MGVRDPTDIHPTANRPDAAALPQSEVAGGAVYLDLLEHAGELIVATDIKGRFVSANRALHRRLGYTLVEARQLSWKKLVPAYHMPRARRIFARHARGEHRIRFELDAITRHGDIASFEIDSRPIFHDGHLAGFHGIARDISERKRMQRDLARVRRELALGRQAQSTLLADMDREIRAPLGDVLRLLALTGRTALSEQQRQYLGIIESSATRALDICNNLCSHGRAENGRLADSAMIRQSFSGAGLHALVVDDNVVNRRFLCALLERYRMTTDQADCGTAAVIACRDRGYDLVLMDIQMADMDGVETARRIRRLPGWRSCPIIAVSAIAADHGERAIIDSDMDGFLPKPVVENHLLELLSRCLPARVTDAGR